MKKTLSLILVFVIVSTLCISTSSIEDYKTEINDLWNHTVYVSRDEIKNSDNTEWLICGEDANKTYDVTAPEGMTGCKFSGWVSADAEITGFGYSINNGNIVKDPDAVIEAEQLIAEAGVGAYESRMLISVPLTDGAQMIRCYVFYGEATELIWQTKFVVGDIETSAKHGGCTDNIKGIKGNAKTNLDVSGSYKFAAGTYDTLEYIGWYGANYAIVEAGYKIDGGEIVYGAWSQNITDGDPIRAEANGGDYAKSLDIPADVSELTDGEHTITYVVKLTECSVMEVFKATIIIGDYDEDYPLSADSNNFSVGYWLNPASAGNFIDVKFTTPNCFEGFRAFIFATPAASGGCQAEIGLYSDDFKVESLDYTFNGDGWQSVKFSRSYPAGEYTLRFAGADSRTDVARYFVIGNNTADPSKNVTVSENTDIYKAPQITLIGGKVTTEPAVAHKDTIYKSIDRLYINNDVLIISDSGVAESGSFIYNTEIKTGDSINILGWLWAEEGVDITGVYYTVDDGNYIATQNNLRSRGDVDAAIGIKGSKGFGSDNDNLTLDGIGFGIPGTHTVKVYAYGNNTLYYLITINLTIKVPTEYINPVFCSSDRLYINTDGLSDLGEPATEDNIYDITVKEGDMINLLGSTYLGEGISLVKVVYSVDDKFYAAENALRDRPDIDAAMGVSGARSIGLDDNALSLFGIDKLECGEYTVKVYAVGSDNNYYNYILINLTVEPESVSVEKVAASCDTVGYTPAGGAEVTLQDGEVNNYLKINPLSCEKGAWTSVYLRGWTGYNYAIDTFGYKIDGGSFIAGDFAQATEDTVREIAGEYASRYKAVIPVVSLDSGKHTVAACAKLANGIIDILWTTEITITKATTFEAFNVDAVGYTSAAGYEVMLMEGNTESYLTNNPLRCYNGEWTSVYLRGLAGYDCAIDTFGYRIDGGDFIAGDFVQATEDAVKRAFGEYASRYKVVIPVNTLDIGNHTVAVCVKLSNGEFFDIYVTGLTIKSTNIEFVGASCDETGYTFVAGAEVILNDGDVKRYLEDNPLSFYYGKYSSVYLRGWAGYTDTVLTFGYKIDGGNYIVANIARPVENAIKEVGGEYASGYKVVVPITDMNSGKHTVTVCAEFNNGKIIDVWSTDITIIKPVEFIGSDYNTVGYTPVGEDEVMLNDGEADFYLNKNPLICKHNSWESVYLRGWVGYDAAIDTFGYKIDGGDFIAGNFAEDTENAIKNDGGLYASRFKVVIPVESMTAGDHKVVACVKLVNGEIYEIWSANIAIIIPAISVGISCDAVGYTPIGENEVTLKNGEAIKYLSENPLSCYYGKWTSVYLSGWSGYDNTIDTFGYKIDGGEFVAGDFSQTTEGAVKEAGGDNASRFKVVIPVASLEVGEHTVAAYVKLKNGETVEIWTADITILKYEELVAISYDTVGFAYNEPGYFTETLTDNDAKNYLASNPLSFDYNSCYSVYLYGWAGYNYAIDTFGYRIDGGNFVDGYFSRDATDVIKDIGGEYALRYKIVIPTEYLEIGKHTVTACAKLSNGEIVEMWVVDIIILLRTEQLDCSIDTVGYTPIGGEETVLYNGTGDDNNHLWSNLLRHDYGTWNSIFLSGWTSFNCPIESFGYTIDFGDYITGDFLQDTEDALKETKGENTSRFKIVIPTEAFDIGVHSISVCVRLSNGFVYQGLLDFIIRTEISAKEIGSSYNTIGYTSIDGSEVILSNENVESYLADNPLSYKYKAWTSVYLSGWAGYNYAIDTFGYKIDGGDFNNNDYACYTEDAVMKAGGSNAIRFKAIIPTKYLEAGKHNIAVCAKLNNGNIVEIFTTDITVVKLSETELVGVSHETVGYDNIIDTYPYKCEEEILCDGNADDYLIDNPQKIYSEMYMSMILGGWVGYNKAIETFGYRIDTLGFDPEDFTAGEFVPGDFKQVTENAVKAIGGEYASCFKATIPIIDLESNYYRINVCAKLSNGDIVDVWTVDIAVYDKYNRVEYSINKMGYTPVGEEGVTLSKNYTMTCYEGEWESIYYSGDIQYKQPCKFYYYIDDGDYINGDFTSLIDKFTYKFNINIYSFYQAFKMIIPIDSLKVGSHDIYIVVRPELSDDYKLAHIVVNIKNPPVEEVSSSCDSVGYTKADGTEVTLCDDGAKAYLNENLLNCDYGAWTSVYLSGWAGYNYAVETFGYKIDGGEFIAGEFAAVAEDAVKALGGKNASRFKVVIPAAALICGGHTVTACVKLSSGDIVDIFSADITINALTDEVIIGYSCDTIGYTPVDGIEVTLKDGDAGDYLADNPLRYVYGLWSTVYMRGWAGYDRAIETFGYKIDGKDFVAGNFTEATGDAVKNAGGENASCFKVVIPVNSLKVGTHKITVYAKLDNGKIVEIWVADITVDRPAAVVDLLAYPDGFMNSDGTVDERNVSDYKPVRPQVNKGEWDYYYMEGWVGFDCAIDTFGYRINDGEFIAGDYVKETEDIVKEKGGKYASRFRIVIPIKTLEEGDYTLNACAKLTNGEIVVFWHINIEVYLRGPKVIGSSVEKVGYTSVGEEDEVMLHDGNAEDYLTDNPLNFDYNSRTSIYLSGWAGYVSAIKNFGYRIENEDYITGDFALDAEDTLKTVGGEYVSRFKVVIPTASLLPGRYRIVVYACTTDNLNYTVFETYITINNVTVETGGSSLNAVGYTPIGDTEKILRDGNAQDYLSENPLICNYRKWSTVYLSGYASYNYPIKTFGYMIDDRYFVAGDFAQYTEEEIKTVNGANASRFKVVIPTATLLAGKHKVAVCAKLENNEIVTVWSVDLNVNAPVKDYLIGDLNNDGYVNAIDRTILARYIAGWTEYTADTFNYEAADVNKDGAVNAFDRTILERYVASWVGYEILPYIVKNN